VNLNASLLIYRYIPGAWLHVTGEDAFTFIQGQLTNDLRALPAGAESVYGLWLNHKGRVQADGFVLAGRERDFWIASYASSADALRERLEAFVIADDVAVTDETPAWTAATMMGGRAEAETVLRDAGGFAFTGRRGIEGAREWIFPRAAGAHVATAWADARAIGPGDMERRRIEAGVPAVPQDIGPAELPNEGGLERDAISFTKGCYLGQEVMARLKSMGQVRRRLMGVRGRGPAPTLPAPLVQAGRPVGELRSAVDTADGFVGLALLTLLHLDVNAPLALASDETVGLAVVSPS